MAGLLIGDNNFSTGTLGSGVTFPTGHIVQTTTEVNGTTNTDVNVGNNTFTATVVTGAITTSSATNSVVVHCGFAWYVNNTSTDAGLSARFKKVHSGGTSNPESLSCYDGSGNNHQIFYTEGHTGQHLGYQQLSMEDPAGGVIGAITYTLEIAEYNCETAGVGNGGGMSARWHIWFQEIQR